MLTIKQENIDLYYKNKPRIFATVPVGLTVLTCFIERFWICYIIEIKIVSLHLEKSYLKSMRNIV